MDKETTTYGTGEYFMPVTLEGVLEAKRKIERIAAEFPSHIMTQAPNGLRRDVDVYAVKLSLPMLEELRVNSVPAPAVKAIPSIWGLQVCVDETLGPDEWRIVDREGNVYGP